MAQEIFIYIDYTDKSKTSITVSSYKSSYQYNQIHDINLLSLIDAIGFTLKGYKLGLLKNNIKH